MNTLSDQKCNSSQNSVADLRALLGQDVLLLAWPLRSKASKKRWSHLTVADMTPAYLRELENGNIGVALGAKSGNLVALDVDVDALVQPFLDLNDSLKATLQTHGARGRVFWFRCSGDYPGKTKKLKSSSGADCGEFRSNGSQSIIHGIHPNGNPYEIVHRASPVTVDFRDIKWPEEIINPPRLDESMAADDTELPSSGVTDVTEATDAVFVSSVSLSTPSLCITLEQVIQMAAPETVHQNNDRLFTLARGIRTLEIDSNPFTPDQLRDAFDQWFKLAEKFRRPDQTRDEYWVQFLSAYASARVPLGQGVIPQAWKAVQTKPAPKEATDNFTDANMHLVVALCRELQIIAGQGPFYLSSRTVQRLLHHDGHVTAARWLKALCTLKILAVVEQGTTKRATRYRYLGSMP